MLDTPSLDEGSGDDSDFREYGDGRSGGGPGITRECARLVPDGGQPDERVGDSDGWTDSRNLDIVGVLFPALTVVVLIAGAFLAVLIEPVLGETASDRVTSANAIAILLGWTLSIGISPYAFHRDKQHLQRDIGWQPSSLYYLLCVPLLNILLSILYVYQRSAATTAVQASQSAGASTRAAGTSRSHTQSEADPFEDLPETFDYRAFLRYAVPYGIGAWVFGAVLAIVGVAANASHEVNPGNPFTDGIFWYLLMHGFVRIEAATHETWMTGGQPEVLILAAIVVLPIILCSALAVRRTDLVPAGISSGAIAGAMVTTGYVIPMTFAAAIIDYDIGDAIQDPFIANFAVAAGDTSVQVAPMSALLAGVFYGVIFGAIGGMTARLRNGTYVLAGILAPLVLLSIVVVWALATV